MVGGKGKGESVWLAFFLLDILKSMQAVALIKKDKNFSEICKNEFEKLSKNIESNGWDGEWYLRAYFDNGDVLGSASNEECRIDSLPQSWSVISSGVSAGRSKTAMENVYKRLVDKNNSLIKLFEPPFNETPNNPGYIKGYLPGVRENGGQYTHAAVWAVIAFAMLKERSKAWELFSLINPVNHSDSPEKCRVYKIEPYVTAGDVYSVEPNAGRGGWSWYTGSSSWMYQLIVRYLLGIKLKIDRLYFEPLLPRNWNSLKIHYRYRETFYHIDIKREGRGDDVLSVVADGAVQEDKSVRLVDDRVTHSVLITLS